MPVPGLKNLWVMEIQAYAGSVVTERLEEFELRLDFDNDRHHLVKIKPGATAAEVSKELLLLAYALEGDHSLD